MQLWKGLAPFLEGTALALAETRIQWTTPGQFPWDNTPCTPPLLSWRSRRNPPHLPLHDWQRIELRWSRVSFQYKLCQRQSRHPPSLVQWFHILVIKPSTSQETIQGKELQFSNAQNKIIFWRSGKINANKNLPYLQFFGCSDPLVPLELSQGT